MELQFGGFTFCLERGERAYLLYRGTKSPFAECVLSGQNKLSRDGKHVPTAEGEALRFYEYRLMDDTLEIEQRSASLSSTVVFRRYPDCKTLRVFHRIRNVSDLPVGVAQVSAFVLYGICRDEIPDLKRTQLYRFWNSWHCECQPRRMSLFEAGLYSPGHASFRRIYGCNKGGWSSKEELPQGILRLGRGGHLMFAVESPNDWYWDLGECAGGIYLYAGGADAYEHEWEVRLRPGECYETPAVALVEGDSMDGVIGEMTKYRRHIAGGHTADEGLPVVFNDYMHLSWDNPTEDRTKKMAPVAALLGADIYVIDCGWHNEEDGSVIYPYVGAWRESKKRFPHGIRAAIDNIHALGMKAGLWLEPEVVGQFCEEMIGYYPDDAWFSLDGRPVLVGGRRFLDFRCEAVRKYMDGVVDRIVQEYGADYLKFDYNQDCGSGTDALGDKPGRGLELASKAFFSWVEGIRKRYPALILEGCASGGQRLDHATTSACALLSSSDQTDYKKYPWIAANIFSAVLPEQAGVWSYPVDSWAAGFEATETWVHSHVDDEAVAMNMVNAMLGRIHLASHVELLTDRQRVLVREGIKLMKELSPFKKRALPCFPNGFAKFGDHSACCGLSDGRKLLLAVWNTGGRGAIRIRLPAFRGAKAEVLYPKELPSSFAFEDGVFTAMLPKGYSARLFGLTLGS